MMYLIPAPSSPLRTPENIHTPPTEGIGISWGMGDSVSPKNLKKCVKLIWNFQRGEGVLEKISSVGRYGYFLELHIGDSHIKRTGVCHTF